MDVTKVDVTREVTTRDLWWLTVRRRPGCLILRVSSSVSSRKLLSSLHLAPRQEPLLIPPRPRPPRPHPRYLRHPTLGALAVTWCTVAGSYSITGPTSEFTTISNSLERHQENIKFRLVAPALGLPVSPPSLPPPPQNKCNCQGSLPEVPSGLMEMNSPVTTETVRTTADT